MMALSKYQPRVSTNSFELFKPVLNPVSQIATTSTVFTQRIVTS